MGFTFGTEIQKYTDEMSFELISKAVLTTDLMGQISVRSGLSAGKVAINLMDGDFNVSPRACGLANEGGDINFSQVFIEIADKQIKMEVCPNDLREYYLSQKMSPSAVAGGEEVPFSEVIAAYYVEKIKNYNEGFLINGDVNDTVPGTATGIEAQVKAASTLIPVGAAAWNVGNAIDQALDLYDAMAEELKDRNDIIMLVSPANYRTLTRALVAAGGTGLFHYNYGDGQGDLYLPGTNCKVVKTSGLTGSSFVTVGAAEFIVAGTGLTDDMSSFGMFYAPADDVVKVRAYWRLGVAVHQADLFAHNNL